MISSRKGNYFLGLAAAERSAGGFTTCGAVAALYLYRVCMALTAFIVGAIGRVAMDAGVPFGLFAYVGRTLTFAVKAFAAGAAALFRFLAAHVNMTQTAAFLTVVLTIGNSTF